MAVTTGAFVATGIVVDDLDRSIAFYTDVVGMQEQRRIDVPDMSLIEVMMGFAGRRGPALILMRYTDGPPRRYVDIGGKLVVSVADSTAVLEAARAGGGTVSREPKAYPGLGLIGFITDPDGYTIEVIGAAAG